jgi:hypothetical protein
MSQTAPVDQADHWRQLDVRHSLNPFSDDRSLKKEEEVPMLKVLMGEAG